jgi:hypothetical protein
MREIERRKRERKKMREKERDKKLVVDKQRKAVKESGKIRERE